MALEGGYLGAPGQSGDDPSQGGSPVASAASAGIIPQQFSQAQAAEIMRALMQNRVGAGGGLAFGPVAPQGPHLPQPPIIPQGPGIPQGSFQTSGERKRAESQALFGTIKDIVDKAQTQHYNMKVDKIKADFDMLSGAIKGYQEAIQAGDMGAAKHNADIINSIVMDPKKSKEMAKAFNVNLNPMAEQKKKEKPNPALDALKATFAKDTQAFQNKESMLSPQAAAMMRGMPQQLGIDPRTALMEQLTKSGVLPKAGEQLTFASDIMKIQREIYTNKVTNDTKENIARLFAQSRDRATTAGLLRTANTIKGANDRMAVLERMWDQRSKRLLEGINNRTNAMKDRTRQLSNSADDKKLSILVGGLDKTANEINKDLEDARKAHDTQRMARDSQKLESLQLMQQMANAEVARRLNLNPEDYNQEQIRLDDEMMRNFESLFPDMVEGKSDDATTE